MKKYDLFVWGVAVALATVLLCCLYPFILDWIGIKEDEKSRFGDMYGALNTFFSGLAFAGLIFTLLMQRRELAMQREELGLTREELRGQREELENQAKEMLEQNKTLNQQRFENTFFHLISTHQAIVAKMPPHITTKSDGSKTQTDFITAIYTRLYHKRIGAQKTYFINSPREHDTLNLQIKNFYETLRGFAELWPFFSHLYNTIKFVDESPLINEHEKYNYICFLRAQLTFFELWVIFYYCLEGKEQVTLKPLIEKYALFKDLNTELLILPEDKEKYAAGAYEHA